MQNKGFVKVFAVLLTLVCVFYLSFSFVTRHYTNKAKEIANGDPKVEQDYLDSLSNEKVMLWNWTLKQCREMEISLGLDLKGGMNVILEVSVPDVIKALADNKPDEAFNNALATAAKQAVNSQDDVITLFIREYHKIAPDAKLSELFATQQLKDKVNQKSSDAEVEKVLRAEVKAAVENSYNVLRTRIDRFGVVQPNIQSLEDKMGRIMVELPGIKEPERVRKLLQGSANLEFWETYTAKEILPAMQSADSKLRAILSQETAADSTATNATADTIPAAKLAEATPAKKAVSVADSLAATLKGDAKDEKAGANMEEIKKQYPLLAVLQLNSSGQGPVIGYANYKDTADINRYLSMPEIQSELPKDLRLKWGVSPSEFDKKGQTFELYAIKSTERNGKAPLEGDVVTDAKDEFDQYSKPAVSMTMNSDGARRWAQLTKQNIGRSIAIVLDNYVYSAPNVNSEITGGRSQITGHFTPEQAKDLANVLKSGKMPAPAHIVQEDIVGPSLGQESINAGIFSFVVALILLMIYMCSMYGFIPGMVANCALFLNFFFTLGILSSFQAALTMSGIAGMVLSLGMAVDANVIIISRIREEIAAGKSVLTSIKTGYKKAMSAIIDGNVTTFIAALVLMWLGSGTVKGFAYTLIISLIVSMFTALVISRLLNLAFYAVGCRNEKLYGRAKEHKTIDFMKHRWVCFILSLVVIVAGFVGMIGYGAAGKGALNFSLEFKGGTSISADFGKDYTVEQVEDKIVPEVAKVINDNAIQASTVSGSNVVTIKTKTLSLSEREEVNQMLVDKFGVDEATIESQSIGSTISNEMRSNAVKALIVACIFMLFYIWFRFKDIRFAGSAIIALVHDVLVMLTGYALIRISVGNTFIACMLTIVGYSINATIVIFDRIREEMKTKKRGEELDVLVNRCITRTLTRSIYTSLTTFVMVAVLFIMGVSSIKEFALPLMAGLICGAYSSICIATELWYVMKIHVGKNKVTE